MDKIDFLDLRNNGTITDSQYQLLSWYGYCLMMYSAHKEDKYYYLGLAYHNSCQISGIDSKYLSDISYNSNYKGLQNFNRLSSFETIQ